MHQLLIITSSKYNVKSFQNSINFLNRFSGNYFAHQHIFSTSFAVRKKIKQRGYILHLITNPAKTKIASSGRFSYNITPKTSISVSL